MTSGNPKEEVLKAAEKEKEEVIKSTQDPEPDPSRSLESHEIDYQQQKLREAEDTHGLRITYSSRIFWLVCIWLFLVVLSVFMTGFNMWGFNLSDKVLMTFITSTTVSVVGLFVVVAKWMFPNNKK